MMQIDTTSNTTTAMYITLFVTPYFVWCMQQRKEPNWKNAVYLAYTETMYMKKCQPPGRYPRDFTCIRVERQTEERAREKKGKEKESAITRRCDRSIFMVS